MAEGGRTDRTLTLAAVGDICLSGTVGRQVEEHGFDWPFEAMKPVLQSADLLFREHGVRGLAARLPGRVVSILRGWSASLMGLRR